MGSKKHENLQPNESTIIEPVGWATPCSRSPSLPIDLENRLKRLTINEELQLHKDHEIIKGIGEGNFGHVVLATIRSNGKQCAIKIIETGTDTTEEEANAEAEILRELKHDNIVRYLSSWKSGNFVHISMEYCANGTLRNLIEKGIDSKHRWTLLYQVFQVLNFMHQRRVAHCDLKSDNILIDDNGRPKIIDFGLAERLEPLYSPDQQIIAYNGRDADLIKGDISDVARVLYEMCYGPFVDDESLDKSLEQFSPKSILPPSENIEDNFPREDHLIQSLYNRELHKLPRPKPGEMVDSEKELITESIDRETNVGTSAEDQLPPTADTSADKKFERFQDSGLHVFVVFIIMCFVFIVLYFYNTAIQTSLRFCAQIHRTVEKTMAYKKAYFEIVKVIDRVM